MAYLLDADVFIQAKQRHYGMDFCPGFWDWLEQGNDAESVFSIEKVADELEVGGDRLSEWTKARGERFFLPPDEPMLDSLAEVAEWVRSRRYRPAAVSTFLDSADYYLVSHAHAHEHVVVNARGTKRCSQTGEDPRCLYRAGREMCESLRDAAA